MSNYVYELDVEDDELYGLETDEPEEEPEDDTEEEPEDDTEFYIERTQRSRGSRGASFNYRQAKPATPGKRAPLPVNRVVPGANGGVSSATLQTPRGNAEIKLDAKVPTRAEFTAAVKKLSDLIAKNTQRINTIQSDVTKLGKSVSSVSKSVDSLASTTKKNFEEVRRNQTAAEAKQKKELAKLRKEQQAQAQSNMLIAFLMQNQIQASLKDHTHDLTAGAAKTAAANVTSSSSDMLPLLLMMSMGSGSGGSGGMFGGGDGGMGMLLMVMMLGK